MAQKLTESGRHASIVSKTYLAKTKQIGALMRFSEKLDFNSQAGG